MQNQFSRSWVKRCSAIGLAAVLGGAGLWGMGEDVLARRTDLTTNPIPPLAQLPVVDLQGEVETLEIDPNIPPNPVRDVLNRGILISAVAIPGDPIEPEG